MLIINSCDSETEVYVYDTEDDITEIVPKSQIEQARRNGVKFSDDILKGLKKQSLLQNGVFKAMLVGTSIHILFLKSGNAEIVLDNSITDIRFINKGSTGTNLVIKGGRLRNMNSMFCEMGGALLSLDISAVDTSRVVSAIYAFSSCRNLKELDLSKNDLSRVGNMFGMFQNCGLLRKLNAPTLSWYESDVQNIFTGCNNLEIL